MHHYLNQRFLLHGHHLVTGDLFLTLVALAQEDVRDTPSDLTLQQTQFCKQV